MEPAVQRIVDRVQSSQPAAAEAVLPPSMRPKPQGPSPKPRTASVEVPGIGSFTAGGSR
jgi:hypothetical protein